MRPELLAPAGDWESLLAALRFGADAVYVGGDGLQLRAARTAFSREELQRAVETVHSRGKRLYVTVNAFVKSEELPKLADYAQFLRDIQADGAIISDLGALAVFGRAAPELPRHVSTQASCMNYAAAEVYRDLGASRIVLARELSLPEIRALRDGTPEDVELEAFVHGAMCMAVSGRCLMSSFMASRSGNRGSCAQPCRWHYRLSEEKRPDETFDVLEEDGYAAILSSHDLNCIDLLDGLRDAGVASFKIEGRMKTAYYVATAVNAYRKRLDGSASPETCREELNALRHRPYSTGFYLGELGKNHFNGGAYESTCTFVGNVLAWEDGVATVRQRNRFAVGERLELLSPTNTGASFTVERIENGQGECVEAAPHPNEIVRLPCPVRAEAGDFLRRREVV